MATLLETPASLCDKARKATGENRDVTLDPGVVRSIAELWHADKEKIRYLESLIIRIGKTTEQTVTINCSADTGDLVKSIDCVLGALKSGAESQ